MAYVKHTGSAIEYQGESFSKTLTKDSNIIWASNEEGNYVLIKDTSKEVVDSGSLTKSTDNKSLILLIGKTTTADLQGAYTLLIYQTDTDFTEINNLIAEYKMTYKAR